MTVNELAERITVFELFEWSEVFKMEHEAHDKAMRDAKRRR